MLEVILRFPYNISIFGVAGNYSYFCWYS